MNGCLQPRSNVVRLYLPRKEGGKGLIGAEECVKEWKSLHGYLRNSTEWMLQMVFKEKVLVEEEDLQDYTVQEEKERGETKQLEGKSPTWRVFSANFRCGWTERSPGDG